MTEEYFDILDEYGNKTGISRPRSEVHSLGLYHRAIHVWLFCKETGEILLQQRALCKDSWAGRWDVSCAGHISAGGESLPSAVRELNEELGLNLPEERFRFLFTHLEILDSIQKGKPFLNHEFNDVYVIELTKSERDLLDPKKAEFRQDCEDLSEVGQWKFRFQESEVAAVEFINWRECYILYNTKDERIVPSSGFEESYSRLFKWIAHELGETL